MHITRVLVPVAAGMLAAACDHAPAAGDTAAAQQLPPPRNAVAALAHRDPSRVAGDTLDLVSYAGRPLPDPTTAGLPCDAAATPLLQRLVFTNDSSYRGITVVRPGCRDPRTSSSDTLVHASTYSVIGDTLMIYSGDGDEVFQWITARLLPDSVVPFPGGGDGDSRFVRRHGAAPRS